MAKNYTKRISILSKELKLSEAELADIIVCDHELRNLIPKKNLITIDVDLYKKAQAFVDKISKNLCVSIDSVIMSGLLRYLANNKS
jgi:hypothetical protein